MTVRTRERLKYLVATVASVGVASAAATTLYKHVDKDGRVTYTDQPRAGSSGKVLTIPIDQNRLAPPAPTQLAPAPREETEYEKIIRRKPAVPDEAEVKAAQKRLANAKDALQQEQESNRPEDWIRRPKGGGPGTGTLRFPRPEYAERLAAREADVKAAEEQLAEAERKERLR